MSKHWKKNLVGNARQKVMWKESQKSDGVQYDGPKNLNIIKQGTYEYERRIVVKQSMKTQGKRTEKQ